MGAHKGWNTIRGAVNDGNFTAVAAAVNGMDGEDDPDYENMDGMDTMVSLQANCRYLLATFMYMYDTFCSMRVPSRRSR